MRVSAVRVRRFRGIDDFVASFSPGINVIKGPNEAGKSSILQAVIVGLLGRATSTAREVQRAKSWHYDLMYEITLEFAARDHNYVLAKDFEHRTAVLRRIDTGEEWHDETRIREVVAGLLGCSSPEIYRAVACVGHDQMAAITAPDQKAVMKALQQIAAGGAAGLDPDAAIGRLHEAVLWWRRGLDSPAREVGPIARLRGEVERLEGRVQALSSQLAAWTEARQELDEVKRMLSGRQQRAALLEELCLAARERGRLEKEIAGKQKEIESISARLDVAAESRRMLARLERDLAPVERFAPVDEALLAELERLEARGSAASRRGLWLRVAGLLLLAGALAGVFVVGGGLAAGLPAFRRGSGPVRGGCRR